MNDHIKERIVTTARISTNALTRNAGHGSFARAGIDGVQKLARAAWLAQRPGHEPCARTYADRSGSPGAGNV